MGRLRARRIQDELQSQDHPSAVAGYRALERQRARQEAAEAAIGADWQNSDDLVFTDTLGRPLKGDGVSHAFAKLLIGAGVKHVPFHALRYSWATVALASGVRLKVMWRLNEVYPRDHPNAGRRRFRRAAISLRKGSAKTELGAAICAAELGGPVRCDGWRRDGREWMPVGAPVRDPYIPMLAYTEEQSEELAYGALYVMLSEGPLASDFDFGLERIMRTTGDARLPLSPPPLVGSGLHAYCLRAHRPPCARSRAGSPVLRRHLGAGSASPEGSPTGSPAPKSDETR